MIGRDPDLQHAVECLLHRANERKYCPICARPKGHRPNCPILALNTILNNRVPRPAQTQAGDSNG